MADKFEKATGRDLPAWMELMKTSDSGAVDLRDLSHQEMVALAVSGGTSDWWAQNIAVEVERFIGRRRVGQTVTGSVSASATKTVPGEWTRVFESFVRFMAEGWPRLLPADPAQEEPVCSATEKWRYWRIRLVDGSTVSLTCSDTSQGEVAKTRLSFSHDRLPSMAERKDVRLHWRKVLVQFAATLK